VEGIPAQLLPTIGVTVIVAVIGDVPVFVAVKEDISPEPPAPNPILVLVFAHVNVPPAGVLTKVVAGTRSLLHNEKSEGTLTVGVGLTVIV
jgi:hypothetical protein